MSCVINPDSALAVQHEAHLFPFADAHVSYNDVHQTLTYQPTALVAIWILNGHSSLGLLANPQLQYGILYDWYRLYRQTGGEVDSVMEEMMSHQGRDGLLPAWVGCLQRGGLRCDDPHAHAAAVRSIATA